jgi:4-oxalocrotonate tautomerase family enzyme
MPQVDITVIGSAPSAEQKQLLFHKLTDLMVEVLGRPRNLVMVSVTPAEASDWAVGGVSSSVAGVLGAQAVVRIIAGSNSDDQKARMIAETTKVLGEVLGPTALPLYVTFAETPPASWGFNGQTVAALQKARNNS